jgi:cell division initiation protein
MKTPEQIRDMEFQKAPMGGYKQSDVELFLEEVASEIEILMKQKADAERKLQEFNKRSPEAALTAAGIQNVLISAQKVADQLTDEAKNEAEHIIADANLKLAEAKLKAGEIIADSEKTAMLLGATAEKEAARIIAEAIQKSDEIIAAANESVELQQKLYDRMKIEIADFKKKTMTQFAAMNELMGQLPDEIPFNIERAKTVLSTDFSNPEELLRTAVEARLAVENKEEAPKEVEEAEEPQIEQEVIVEKPVSEPVEETEVPSELDDAQLFITGFVSEEQENLEDASEETQSQGFVIADEEMVTTRKGHISFGEDDDDDDDDDDDEPRSFFRRKKR